VRIGAWIAIGGGPEDNAEQRWRGPIEARSSAATPRQAGTLQLDGA
jgi:hypothetical protein